MNTSFRSFALIWLMSCLAFGSPQEASAGTFKHITIDGTFTDWAGVPPAAVDDEGDEIPGTLGGFDLREVYVANDDQYVYLRIVIHSSSSNTDYTKYHHHFYIDSDNDPATGHAVYGLGSEMLIEDAGGYSERYGTFNDGEMTGLDWAQAPAGILPAFQYEARFSRSVRDTQPADVPAGSGNPERDLLLLTQDAIAIAFEVEDSNWAVTDAGSAFPYEIAPTPPPFSGTRILVDLTAANWRINDTGEDLGTDWLAMTYDDSQAGWKEGTGLFGFNAPTGIYPAPVNTVLARDRSTYYFRTHFTWDYDQNGVGLLLSNYLSAGAVFYLNGTELCRVRMPEGPVAYTTSATGAPPQPGAAEVFDLPTTALVVGDNILEVEVHPAAGATSSLVFGDSLIASDSFPPRIQDPTQPADRNVIEGQATSFSPGSITGTQPFKYQWLKNGAPIPDATNATFTLDSVTTADAGAYSVEIANPKGIKVSSRAAVLTTTPVEITLTDPKLPGDQVVIEGTSATFMVSVTGTLPVYQWYREGEPIEGETGSQLVLDSVPFSENGQRYWVVISNRLNSVTSRQATLTVTRDSTSPGITSARGGGRKVIAVFSEPLNSLSAQQVSNYTLDGGLQIQNAALDSTDPQTVTLTTTQQEFGRTYTLSVAGVEDRFGNAAIASSVFRSTIVIDGDLEDWTSVPTALVQDQFAPDTIEFKELSMTNDNEYLFLRFSFYAPVGPLGPDNWNDRRHHYDIVIDTDQDPATGTWSGGDLLIEDDGVYRLAGEWTQGVFTDGDVDIAPGETPATDFEIRISRGAKHQADALPAFPNPSINVFIVVQTMGWSVLDQTSPPVSYTFVEFPPLPSTPGPLTASRAGSKVALTWPGGGVLETRASLNTGSWMTVPGATSGIQIDPASASAAYYRLRNP